MNPAMLSMMNGLQLQGQTPAPTPAATPAQPGWMTGLTNTMNNPLFAMGMGLLGGNYGNNSKAAFANAMQGGLRGMQLASMNQRRNKEMMLEEKKQEKADAEYAAMQKAHAARVANDPTLSVFGPKNSAAAALEARKQGARQKAIASMQTPEGQASLAYLQQQGGLTNKEAVNAYLGGGASTKIELNTGAPRATYLTDAEKVQGGFDPKQPMVWDKNGIPKPIKSTSFTGEQLTASNYANRMSASEEVLEKLENEGFESGQLAPHLAAKVPLGAGNFAMTPEQQQHRQAEDDWIRAKLRKESGAVIGEQEMESERQVYFPQPGDSEEAKTNKKRARKEAMKGMTTMAGGAYEAAPKNDSTNETWEDDQYMYRKVPDGNGGFKTQRRKK